MSFDIDLYRLNDFHHTGNAMIEIEMFGRKHSLYSTDVRQVLQALGEVRSQLGNEHCISEYNYEYSEFHLFYVSPELADLDDDDLDVGELAEWWLFRIARPQDMNRPLTPREFADLHMVRDEERAAERDRQSIERGYVLQSPHVCLTLDDWAQDTVRAEIDRVAADLKEQGAAADAALAEAIAAADAEVGADMAGVEWTTRRVGEWHRYDGNTIHEFVHTITVDGETFKVREGDLFDVGPYIKFEGGVQRSDSPQAERVYALVEKYGERAQGSLGTRTM